MKTLVLGLDGATFDVLDPMVASGVMPFLGQVMRAGSRAILRSTVPPLTPPAWTSIMTGRSPGRHGIFDFFRMESTETRHIRFATSRDVCTETIWSISSRSGRRVASLNFPLMYPPPEVSGYVVPGWVPWRALKLACHPQGLFEQLRAGVPGFEPRELAMDVKLEEKATEGVAEAEYGPWVELHTRREENWSRVLDHILRSDDVDLAAVVFDGVDKLQHLCWRFIDSAAFAATANADPRVRALCLEYFRRLDEILRRACGHASEETTVLVVSDHGFGPTRDVFHVNAWLAQRGNLTWTDAAARPEDQSDAFLGVGQVARHTFQMDWTKTVAFATTPTSNGIYIVVDRNGSGVGIPPSKYEAFRAHMAEDLRRVRDPETGEPVVRQIWTREEAFAGPRVKEAPDLTLGLRDGGLVSILPSDSIVRKRPQTAGAHRPEGIFLAKGPGIRRGASLGDLAVVDVAPTVLHSLGLPVPEDLEGRVPAEMYEPEILRSHPVRIGPATIPPGESAEARQPDSGLTPEHEQIITERLRNLGYID